MKIIALTPFRDEAPFLPHFIASLRPAVDEIIALDDRSTDGGDDLLRDVGARIIRPTSVRTEGNKRATLLEEGRRRGGTHFVVIDADEVLTEPLTESLRLSITKLKSGESLAAPLLSLWRSSWCFRIGREYNMPLCCMFRDDGVAAYGNTFIHESRVPGTLRLKETLNELPMVHLQFVAWHRAQVKQAWYRVQELLSGKSALGVNARYLSTLDGPLVRTRPFDPALLRHIPPVGPLEDLPPGWQLEELYQLFSEHGPEHFERLQIWHVPELRDRFVDVVGREPRPSIQLGAITARAVADLYGSSRALVRRVRRPRSSGGAPSGSGAPTPG
ncbi:MAG: glycosyltransferase family 2 protein [Acidimicrobiales bacterium]